MKKLELSVLLEAVRYDETSGLFTWRSNRAANARAGNIAGMFDSNNGYVRIRIAGRIYLAHRLAWLYSYGVMPEGEIDHINGIRSDNRLANLRQCRRQENGRNLPLKKNNSSGFPGVSWDRKRYLWAAYIFVDRHKINLGRFPTLELAALARHNAERVYFGEFARVG